MPAQYGDGKPTTSSLFDDGALSRNLRPERYRFFIGQLPTRLFLEPSQEHGHDPSLRSWKQWLDEEINDPEMLEDRGPRYWIELTTAWLSDPESVGAVSVLIDRQGRWDIGDGWHRIAISIVSKQPTIYAIWGEER